MSRKLVLDYVKMKYKTVAEYPWAKTPKNAVLRHNDNAKWYGIIMNVRASRLGLIDANKEDQTEVDVLNVKCEPFLIDVLQGQKGFLPAYHMNKRHWISIVLDNSVLDQEIYKLIDKSYEMTS